MGEVLQTLSDESVELRVISGAGRRAELAGVDAVLDLRSESGGTPDEDPPLGIWRFEDVGVEGGGAWRRLVARRSDGLWVLRGALLGADSLAVAGVEQRSRRWPLEVAMSLGLLPWDAVAQPAGAGTRVTRRGGGLIDALRSHLNAERIVEKNHWCVGLGRGVASGLFGPALPPVTWLEAPEGHYYADPFLIEVEGRLVLFVEDWDHASQLGTIRAAEVVDGVPQAFRLVLREPYHLSYPFVLQAQGRTFLVPEQEAAGGVYLYEAEEFPWRWSRGPRLVEGHFVDPTLWIDGRDYWLWVSRGGRYFADELHLFHGSCIEGPYEPHPQNPVVTLPNRCRAAGPPFRIGNRLFRPAQNCEMHYGEGLLLYEVEQLTRERYAERLIRSIGPSEGLGQRDGLHQFSSASGLVALDASQYIRQRVPLWQSFRGWLRGRIGRLQSRFFFA